MKNTQHTPGPWSVAFYGETERPVIKHGNQSIADVRGCELDDSTSHSLANARLVAASPDLLAFAREAVKAWELYATQEGFAEDGSQEPEYVTIGRAAIAKAEGNA
jgi:hypothetical protein